MLIKNKLVINKRILRISLFVAALILMFDTKEEIKLEKLKTDEDQTTYSLSIICYECCR